MSEHTERRNTNPFGLVLDTPGQRGRELCALGHHAWVPWLQMPNVPGSYTTWCAREHCDHVETVSDHNQRHGTCPHCNGSGPAVEVVACGCGNTALPGEDHHSNCSARAPKQPTGDAS